MPIPGNLRTTAMAVMPHRSVEAALDLALTLDIPFWPQLPLLNYHEDMYVQAAEHFPGIVLDVAKRRLGFDLTKFADELEDTLAHFEDPDYFDVSEAYSAVYHRFLAMDLAERPAIRGQLEGPVSFGLNVLDQDGRPILFDDTVRPFMLDFMARRINVQLRRLQGMNPNAFMFVDEPGLQFLFSALSGYDGMRAQGDLDYFFAQVERPRGIHLCGNPDWDFLLNRDLDILSLDVYQNGEIFSSYTPAIKRFLDRDGILVWGIVPTNLEPFGTESETTLAQRLTGLWDFLAAKGVDREQLLAQSLLSPATCCLVNPDGSATVEKAFATVIRLAESLQRRYGL